MALRKFQSFVPEVGTFSKRSRTLVFETAVRIDNIPQTGNLIQQDLKPLVHVRV